MASKFRGVKWNNARFPSTIKIRRSIDLAELGDFGSITENPSDLPTRGAAHRADHGGSTSATRGHTDLRGIAGQHSNVVDTQDMGLISDATTTHRIWSAMGAITDIVTEAPTTLYNPDSSGSSGTVPTPTVADFSTTTLLHTLDNPDVYASLGDQFGYSVAMSDTYAIVGAYAEDDANGTDSGKAYIYDVTTGSLLHTLDNPNAYGTSKYDRFGNAVAISDTYAIVGAWSEDDASGSSSGKAYVFDVTTGNLVHTLNNPNAYGTSTGDKFSRDLVAISDTHAIVGAYAEDTNGTDSGIVYVFDVTTGDLVHTLDNPNAYGSGTGDSFGNSVAMSDTHAIVGARGEDDTGGGDQSGKAYIFDVTTGSLLHTLDNPNAYGTSNYDFFGYSVAMSDTHAIVGAHYEDDAGGNSSGKAYVFDVTTGDLVHTLDNPNAYAGSAGDSFGQSVAITNTYAIVGAKAERDAGGSSSGKAYIFDVSTGNLVNTLDNPNAHGSSNGDYFGTSVAINNTHAIVGAYGEEDSSGNISGKSYIFAGEQ